KNDEIMGELVRIRERIVAGCLKETIRFYFESLFSNCNVKGDISSLCLDNGLPIKLFVYAGDRKVREVVINIPGSRFLTSDIDITFEVMEFENNSTRGVEKDTETDGLVGCFNHCFRNNYFLESGYLFDVNVYSYGFLGQMGKIKPLNFKIRKQRRELRLAFSFLSIRQALTDQEWEIYKQDILEKVNAEAALKVVKDLENVFSLCNKLYRKIRSEIDFMMNKVKDYTIYADMNDEVVELYARNLLYAKYLCKCSDLIESYDKKEHGKFDEEGDSLVLEWEKIQGMALAFAYDAYYCFASTKHVVEGMQEGKIVELTRHQLVESALMNLGCAVKSFRDLYDIGNEKQRAKAVLIASKYLTRVMDAVYRAKEKGWDYKDKIFDDLLKEAKQLVILAKKQNIITFCQMLQSNRIGSDRGQLGKRRRIEKSLVDTEDLSEKLLSAGKDIICSMYLDDIIRSGSDLGASS
ncbi:hypothetical protein KKC59_04715, partial [bacterium]|nr:hypothetical protein [bacterium]